MKKNKILKEKLGGNKTFYLQGSMLHRDGKCKEHVLCIKEFNVSIRELELMGKTIIIIIAK